MNQTKRQQRLERLSNWLLLGVLAITFFVAFTAPAEGATTEVRLNAIASSAAGKSASVRCTFDAEEWDAQVRATSFNTRRGSSVGGFAYPGADVVFLGPQACFSLYDALFGGVVYAGLNPTAYALLTLLHEAVHLRGVIDEGETDCTALRLFKSYLDDIGVPATVRKAVNVKGKYVLRTVANPNIRLLSLYAQAIHNKRSLEYRGSC